MKNLIENHQFDQHMETLYRLRIKRRLYRQEYPIEKFILRNKYLMRKRFLLKSTNHFIEGVAKFKVLPVLTTFLISDFQRRNLGKRLEKRRSEIYSYYTFPKY